jgi:hypothetical protein
MMFFKKMLVITLFFVSPLLIHAGAPELRNVMPNSWNKVTRLSAGEEAEFLSVNTGITGQIKETLSDAGIRNDYPIPSFFFVCKHETVSGTFYRILCTEQEEPVFLSEPVNSFV